MKSFLSLILLGLLPAVLSITYTPGTDTCEGRCLDHYDLYNTCQCTENCELFGDCCVDFFVYCTEPEIPVDSCEGQCGLFTSGKPCQCNDGCVSFGDCCDDYTELCDGGSNPDESCVGRCDLGYQPELDCQCNDQCEDFDNCCDDYEEICVGVDPGLTCAGRCDIGYDPSETCQCNDQCEEFNNCCNDYVQECTSDEFSCKGKCFANYDGDLACQCNTECGTFGNCCPDYESECFSNTTCRGRCSVVIDADWFCECVDGCDVTGTCCDDYIAECVGTCEGRCDFPFEDDQKCQCNAACLTHSDCCGDYNDVCMNGTGPEPITSADITALAETLWANDINRLSSADYVINKQSMASESNPSDVSDLPFFTSLNESALSSRTFTTFIALLDNYVAQTRTPEVYTLQELQEIEDFLDAVFESDVMNMTTQFFINKGWHAEESEFRAFVQEVWFGNYSRKESDPFFDSSGFEHVFVGEIKSDVTGFHNWLQFYLQEKNANLEYYGYLAENTPNQIAAQFIWDGAVKVYGSMIVGASPEFELAMMSVCFRVKPGAQCAFTLDGSPTKIQTYTIRDIYIGSSYFIV